MESDEFPSERIISYRLIIKPMGEKKPFNNSESSSASYPVKGAVQIVCLAILCKLNTNMLGTQIQNFYKKGLHRQSSGHLEICRMGTVKPT